MPKNVRNWLLLILPVALIAFYLPVLVGKRFFWEDFVEYFYPMLSYLANSVRRFQIPYWSPFVYSGMPFLADIQTQTFYPPNWLLAFFIGNDGRLVFWAVELEVILHLLVAGYLMYRLVKHWQLSQQASVFAGLVFMLSGFMSLRTIHLGVIFTLTWFPLILLLVDQALYGRRWTSGLAAGLVVGLAALGGYPQMLLHMGYVVGAYALVYVVRAWKDRGPRALWLAAGMLIVVGLVGVGIAAIQYLPTLEFTKYSSRSVLKFSDLVDASVRPMQLLTLLVPKFFGSVSGLVGPKTDTVFSWAGEYDYHYWETVIYVGILPLVIALFALSDRKRALRWFWLGLGFTALILALGRYTPLLRIVFTVLPGFNRFRIPGRFSDIFTFAMAILAGFGMERFLSSGSEGAVRITCRALVATVVLAAIIWLLFAAGAFKGLFPDFEDAKLYENSARQWDLFTILAAAAAALFYYRLRRRWSPVIGFWAAIAIAFVDLFLFGSKFNASDVPPEKYVFPKSKGLAYLQRESKVEAFRVNMRNDINFLIGRNQGNLDRVELLEGYTPLGLARYAPFTRPNQRMLDLLNAKYKIDSAGTVLVPNPTYLPRARMVYRYTVVPSESAALAMVRDSEFDYRHEAILEHAPGFDRPPEDSVANDVVGLVRDPNRMELRVETDRPGILVLSEVYYPEWKARVDGKSAGIYPVDYVLRGITMPAGSHRVEMYYDSTLVKHGILVSLITLVLAVALIFTLRQRERSRAAEPGLLRDRTLEVAASASAPGPARPPSEPAPGKARKPKRPRV